MLTALPQAVVAESGTIPVQSGKVGMITQVLDDQYLLSSENSADYAGQRFLTMTGTATACQQDEMDCYNGLGWAVL